MFYLVSQPGRRVEQALLTSFGLSGLNLYMGHIIQVSQYIFIGVGKVVNL